MEARTFEDRTLTELDHARLSRLVELHAGRNAPIEAVLDAAELLPSREVPPDVVTMYTQLVVADPASGEQRKLTLCYPQDADAANGLVSVLSPVGMALLGLPAGATARWQAPSGETGAARIVEILFQPEASGDYTR